MEGKMSVYYETKEAVCITSHFEDFKCHISEEAVPKAEQWRRAYFELLSWKNTWGIPYRMDIDSTHDHEPYLVMIIPKDREDAVVEWLKELGYEDIKPYTLTIATVEEPWDDKFDEIYGWYFE